MPLATDLHAFRGAAAQVAGLSQARAEQSLYGPFDQFLTAAAQSLGYPQLLIVHQVSSGRLVPDFGLFRVDDLVSWVELKAPRKDLNHLTGADRTQFERAQEELEVFILTNGWDWRLYEAGELVRQAILPSDSLNDLSIQIPQNALDDLEQMLDHCFSHRASAVTSAEEASRLMAKRARALRNEVQAPGASGNHMLTELYEDFKGLVYASGRAYTWAEFADAYAQTAVFGLLLSRLDSGVDLALQNATAGVNANRHPFLWRCLDLFTDQTLPADLLVVLQEAVTSINRIPPGLFRRQGGRDPLLYAYETFFAAYNAEERAARGVYYTPPAVVQHQVSGVEVLLQRAFGLTNVLSPEIHYLDPATGTGTYLLTLLERALDVATASGAPADVELASMLEGRIRAFELMVGPYTVAHQRVAAFLADNHVPFGDRLPIYLVDTLAETLGGTIQSRLGAVGRQLTDERQAAEHVKSTEPVLVVLGNPPYDRIKRNQLGDHWLLERIEDVRERTPPKDRINLKALYDYYVAFWRWGLWLIGERELQGVADRGLIAFITNRSWILGRGFGGLRSLFSEWCREVWVLDLGGDYRSARMVLHDENVFDIRVGVAIVFAVVDSDASEMPNVYYRRLWGRRAEKEQALNDAFQATDYMAVSRTDATAPFVPIDWGVLASSPGIEDFFTQHETGIQTSRDELLVGLRAEDVLTVGGGSFDGTIGDWWNLPRADREEAFRPTRTHPAAPTTPPKAGFLREYAYRPLDYRVLYNEPRFVEWPRPGLQRAFARPNMALVTIERGFGAGPAAFPVTALPDLHVFRGRGSRGIYPLWGGEGAGRSRAQLALATANWHANLNPEVVGWADRLLPGASPEDIFAYAAALLGAPSYTTLFEGGLVAERPRIPLTENPELAAEAVLLGTQWTQHWSLASPVPGTVRWDTGGTTAPTFGKANWHPPDQLHVAGRVLHGVAQAVWEYDVSGYPVLRRYCRDREDLPASAASMDQLRRVVGSMTQIVDLGPGLDDLLSRVLAGTLHVF